MRRTLSFLLLVIVPWCLRAQGPGYARSVVNLLASPEFMGRGYVDRADKTVSAYIAEEFMKLGLEPAGGSFFQEFKISVNTFPGRVQLAVDGQNCQPGVDFLVDPSSPAFKGKFDLRQLKRGEIDTAEELAAVLRKFQGEFLLIDNRQDAAETPEAAKKISEHIRFLQYHPQVNLKGIILLSGAKLTWGASTVQAPRPQVHLKSDSMPRSFRKAGLVVESRLLEGYTTRNVVAMVRGSRRPDSLIVLTAHYDHLGKMGDIYFPGANDNASGIAMLLSLAKHFAAQQPDYSIVFAALGAEELGILGARAFTDNPPVRLENIRFLINFDLAGTGEEGIRVVNGSVHKKEFEMLASINREMGLLPRIDTRGAACNSDHCPFHEKGVPCFYIYTQGGIQAYHDIYDRAETLPMTEFEDYFRLMTLFIGRICLMR